MPLKWLTREIKLRDLWKDSSPARPPAPAPVPAPPVRSVPLQGPAPPLPQSPAAPVVPSAQGPVGLKQSPAAPVVPSVPAVLPAQGSVAEKPAFEALKGTSPQDVSGVGAVEKPVLHSPPAEAFRPDPVVKPSVEEPGFAGRSVSGAVPPVGGEHAGVGSGAREPLVARAVDQPGPSLYQHQLPAEPQDVSGVGEVEKPVLLLPPGETSRPGPIVKPSIDEPDLPDPTAPLSGGREPLVARAADQPGPSLYQHKLPSAPAATADEPSAERPVLAGTGPGPVTHGGGPGLRPVESGFAGESVSGAVPPVGGEHAGVGSGAREPLVARAVDQPGPSLYQHTLTQTQPVVAHGSAQGALQPMPDSSPPEREPRPHLRPVPAPEEKSEEAGPEWNGLRPSPQVGRSKHLIGDVAVDLGFASREAVERAVEAAKMESKPTGRVLVESGVLRPDQLAQVIAERFGLDYVDLSVYEIDMGAVNLLDVDAIRRYQAVPVSFTDDGAVLLAMADPTNVLSIDDIAMITGHRVRVAVASAEDLALLATRLGRMEQSIEDIVESDPEAEIQTEALAEEADKDAPVIKLVHSIIAQAVQQGASDIHFNPEEGDTRVLFRVDGVLYPAATVKRRMAMSVVSRIKIMSDLDIAERRVPQDGRFAVTIDQRRVDIRVVTLPLVYGEGAVMRILDKGVVAPNLEYLGMQKSEQDKFSGAIARPHGAVLVTGPTGSGKSTTLYAALNVLNNGERSILTIEDPVESRIPGIKQMQIAPRAGVTFETGLRSMLRADPDVIMVGEIRDRETAHIAVEAALTGHLVLSTLHTRDAPSALGRLMDMGIEPFLVSSSIDCIVAQRLVRMLCKHCKRPMHVSDELLEKYGLRGAEPYEPVGCSRCSGSGYRGRVGLYEVMVISEEIRNQILGQASVDEISASASRQGMRRLRDDGMDKVRAGQTSIAEVERMAASLL